MSGLRLALSLLCIPRLFVSLLLFPLFLSLILIVVQLFATTFAIEAMSQTPEMLQKRIEHTDDNNFVRKFIYGDGKRLEKITVCRWTSHTDENGEQFDNPPLTAECAPDRLDAAIHVDNPETFDPTPYSELLLGNFERLHICRQDCTPDVIITLRGDEIFSHAYSFPGLVLLNQAYFDEPVQSEYVKLVEDRYRIKNLIGTQFLHADGYTDGIQLNNVGYEIGLLVNIAGIIVIGLWLAIKAHRKVLDYFSRSGALLPMVAAMGKREFYSAIWMVTLLRVGAFLLASVPATFMLFNGLGDENAWGGIFEKDIGHFLLWLVTLVISFAFAAIVASIADLKHRHNLFAFAYRYLPLALAVVGGFLWAFSFLLGDGYGLVRDIIISIPILSMGPIIVVPLFQPNLNLLVINALLTVILTLFLVRANSRWFAAHLEDL